MRSGLLSCCILLACSSTTACFEWNDWEDDDWYYDATCGDDSDCGYWPSDCWCDGADCFCGEATPPADCWCDDVGYCRCPSDLPGACMRNADCGAGEVCSLEEFCAPIVANCPLTDECLADPEAFVHSWQGIDPIYAGELQLGAESGLIWFDIEFYDTHLYGEGQIVVGTRSYTVVITGMRDQTYLFGQLLDAWGGRNFDWTYEATLASASELSGTMHFADNNGSFDGSFQLYRISPCGCDIQVECSSNEECGSYQSCIEGSCQRPAELPVASLCRANADCGQGNVCVNGNCTTFCTAHEDCGEDSRCLSGFCLPDCQDDTDCARGELCDAGLCLPLPVFCSADEQCGVAQHCADGSCVASRACIQTEDCSGAESCVQGLCRTLVVGYAAGSGNDD